MICPIKAREFPVDGQSIECDRKCMWLMSMNDTEQYHACAVALVARKLAHNEWIPANYWNEVDE